MQIEWSLRSSRIGQGNGNGQSEDSGEMRRTDKMVLVTSGGKLGKITVNYRHRVTNFTQPT